VFFQERKEGIEKKFPKRNREKADSERKAPLVHPSSGKGKKGEHETGIEGKETKEGSNCRMGGGEGEPTEI